MDEVTRLSADLTRASGDDLFHFDDGDGWMAQLRSAEMPAGLGRIGAYEIIEEVGRGGQGIVYRARQPNTHRQIALKRLVAGAFASSAARRRFEREVEAVSVLNHPSIVTVYGLEVIDGMPLLAMEWIEGKPAHRWAQSTSGAPREVREILALFLRICDAMRHAHARGVIHRDLKPANILVVEADAAESPSAAKDAGGPGQSAPPSNSTAATPKILDFGLAKIMAAQRDAGPEMTMSDEFVGTPAYAAPEQMRLDHAAVDARTDVYSLGVVLFQMLTGQMPYEISRNLTALVNTIENTPPHRPSALNRRIDRELDTIILKSLEKEQSRRYQTVDALAEDVRRFMAGDPILAHPPRASYYVRKMLWRYRLPVGIAAIALLGIAVSAIVAAVQWQRATERYEQAYRDNRALRAQGKMIASALVEIDRASREGDPASVIGALETARKQVDEGFLLGRDAGPIIDGGLAGTYSHLGRLDRAESGYRDALAQLREQGRHDTDVFATFSNELARVLDSRGELEEAESLLRDAWRIRATLRGESHQDVIMTMNDLGVTLLHAGRLIEARALLSQALDRHTALDSASDRDRGILHLNLARALLAEGDADGARRHAYASLTAFTRLKFYRFEDYAQALAFAAELAERQNRLGEAVSQFRGAVEILQECFGEWHPPIAALRLRAAGLHARLGNWDAASTEAERAVAIRRVGLGDQHPLTRDAVEFHARIESSRAAASRPAGTP